MAAAKLYLDATKAMRPAPSGQPVVQPGELTDEELDALLAGDVAPGLAYSRRLMYASH